jgi:transcriptional regulator
MYKVKQYEVSDVSILREVIEKYPFATVTSVCEGKAYVNHLPITGEISSSGKLCLIGHMSRRNSQWEHIRDGSELLIAFQGPHAYINPSWYTENDVPTWNYVVVHAAGPATLIEDHAGLIRILKQLTDHMNRSHEDQWNFFLPDDLKSERDITSAIIGFQMIPVELIGKFKLSQTRSKEDQIRVTESLGSRRDDSSRQLQKWMSKYL